MDNHNILKVLLDKVEQLQHEVKALRDSHLPAFISTKEYAAQTGLDRSTVVRYCKAGKLRHTKRGNRYLIDRKELQL